MMQETGEEAYAATVLASLDDEYPIGEAAVERAFRTLYLGLMLLAVTSLVTVLALVALGHDEGLLHATTALVGYAVLILAASAWLRPRLRSTRVTRNVAGFHLSRWPHPSNFRTPLALDYISRLERLHDENGSTVAIRLASAHKGAELVLRGFTRMDDILEDILSKRAIECVSAPWTDEEERNHYGRPTRYLYAALTLLALMPATMAIAYPGIGWGEVVLSAVLVGFAMLMMSMWTSAVIDGLTYGGTLLRFFAGTVLSWHLLAGLSLVTRWYISTLT